MFELRLFNRIQESGPSVPWYLFSFHPPFTTPSLSNSCFVYSFPARVLVVNRTQQRIDIPSNLEIRLSIQLKMSTTDLDSPMAMAYRINKTFDPWSQDITVTLPDGITTYVANYADIVAVQRSVMIQSVSQGIQVGASFILLVILLLITTRDKRRSIVFILNALALFLVIFRGVFAMFTFAGPFYDFYRWLLYYYSDTRTAQHISCVGEVATFILTVCIELSLVMQVRIVCCNLEDWRRHGITVLNVFAAFVACGIRFALMVVNITWGIVGVESTTYRQSQLISRLASAANITFVVSIGISAVIFCTKLAFAIQSRRSMGMKQFGPMQIIFVMGCQTMCTPRRSRLVPSQSNSY